MPNQLERDALLELTVGALAEEHLTHAPLPDRSHDAKRADLIGNRFGQDVATVEEERLQSNGWCVQEASRAMVRAEQLHHLVVQHGIVSTGAVDERRLISGGKIERCVEHGVDALEAIVRGRAQGTF
jgi:hypothetical protein